MYPKDTRTVIAFGIVADFAARLRPCGRKCHWLGVWGGLWLKERPHWAVLVARRLIVCIAKHIVVVIVRIASSSMLCATNYRSARYCRVFDIAVVWPRRWRLAVHNVQHAVRNVVATSLFSRVLHKVVLWPRVVRGAKHAVRIVVCQLVVCGSGHHGCACHFRAHRLNLVAALCSVHGEHQVSLSQRLGIHTERRKKERSLARG